MDGFVEANQLLANALEELDDIIHNGESTPTTFKSTSDIGFHQTNHLIENNGVDNNNMELGGSGTASTASCKLERISQRMDDIDSGKDLWNGNVWSDDRRGSGASSGVESPPSDIPASMDSRNSNVYEKFVKAIERHQVSEIPDLATKVRIMKWMCGRQEDSFLTASSTTNSIDNFPSDALLASFRGSSSSVFKQPTKGGEYRSPGRSILPYVTRHSDSGFGSAQSTGSSCSYLPPPPPYKMRQKQHKIHRSFSDSKYQSNPLSVVPFEAQRQIRGASWQSQVSLFQSSSPSMSTVSCPEYPELQDKLHRLSLARDSLSLQVSVLTEQVGAQKEKIRDLELMLATKRSRNGSQNKMTSLERLQTLGLGDEGPEFDVRKKELVSEVGNLKMRYASLEREKNETEKRLRMSQNEIDHLESSLHGLPHAASPVEPRFITAPYIHMAQRTKEQQEEMEHLRQAVQRLIADNETKNQQISSLRTALDEHCRGNVYSHSPRWHENQQQFDINAQLRRLLLDDGSSEQMAHSTSFPVSLSSAAHGYDRTPRSAVQSSSSYTSSLSTASPQHSWSQSGTPRHALRPENVMQQPPQYGRIDHSYRAPSSPAARQLAAELDELRRLGDSMQVHQQHNFASTSLPRGMGVKAASTLALPSKKLSIASGTSAGEWGGGSSVGDRRKYRTQFNRWISDKLKRKKRAASVPNLVESDDEVARGRNGHPPSQTSSQKASGTGLRRDRTRSSLRNLFSKLSRSTSQDHGTFRRGTAARSTSTARLASGPLSGAIALRPAFQQFVDWNSDHIAEWIGEIGYPQYVPEVAGYVRSGRHLLNMSGEELERELGIRNPIHRKRLLLILRRIEEDVLEPVDKWDHHQVLRWLEDIGLPQYKDQFSEHLVDGITLLNLTAGDVMEMRITNASHYATLSRSIQYLKMVGFKQNMLERKYDESISSRYPCPNSVVRWSHAATCEWLRSIDLAEFTPNLLCAGVPGALLVFEPAFTAESLAEILQMPAHKTLLRRHLASHFNQLLGQKLISEKRDFLAQGVYPQLMPGIRIKILKKGFSLTRKKAKNEICLEPEEMLCPQDIRHQFPLTAESLLESLDASNV